MIELGFAAWSSETPPNRLKKHVRFEDEQTSLQDKAFWNLRHHNRSRLDESVFSRAWREHSIIDEGPFDDYNLNIRRSSYT